MTEIAKKFLTIFQGRNDAYGGDEGRAIYGTVDEALIQGHLDGTHEPIGIYPIRFVPTHGTNEEEQRRAMRVRWGCCDIDTGEWDEAYRLATVLGAMGLHPWIERSRSKGWHIWVFVDQSVAAYEMRRALKVAYDAIGLPAKEANPKSELLRPTQLGNYVRLPYPGIMSFKDQRVDRQIMMLNWSAAVGDGNPVPLVTFLQHENLYSDPEKIKYWASKWYEPPRTVIVRDAQTTADLERLIEALPRPIKTLYEKGPRVKEGASAPDTSQGLQAIAHNLAQTGQWTPGDVYVIVEAADQRWGKYWERNIPQEYYEDIVRRAFG